MERFEEVAGYTKIGFSQQARTALDRLQELHIRFCVIGGAAIVYHTKHYRDVTPDLDILVSPSSLTALREIGVLHPGTFGVSFEIGRFVVDCIFASSALYRDTIATAIIVDGVPMADIPHLLCIKAEAGRDKDTRDFAALARGHLDLKGQTCMLAKRCGLDMDDIDSLWLIAKHAPESFGRRK